MRRKAEKGKSWFKAKLVLLFMYANGKTVTKDFKPADHLKNQSEIHTISVGIGREKNMSSRLNLAIRRPKGSVFAPRGKRSGREACLHS